MPKIDVFEANSEAYEAWFDRNPFACQSELKAVGELLPEKGKGIEIGVGSGQFAEPLGIGTGIEPSLKMAELARRKGIHVIEAAAESLPLDNDAFDFALMVTTICFVDDPIRAFEEIKRILKPGGDLIVGFVDRESDLGQLYFKNREQSRFYREATFYSTSEVVDLLQQTGFASFQFRQTLFCRNLSEITAIEEPVSGYGQGAFVVVRAKAMIVS